VLSQALKQARAEVRGKNISAQKLKTRLAHIIAAKQEARLDYLEFFDAQTLQPVEQVARGTQMALAVFFGKTRLIDNGVL
jgi:pantoate--beta-alanine ligase